MTTLMSKSHDANLEPRGNTNSSGSRKAKRFEYLRFCFTLNNYSDDNLSNIIDFVISHKGKYIIGKEIGEMGTPHLQGYIELKKKTLINPLMNKCDNKMHIESAKGTLDDNIKYCTKDRNYYSNIPPYDTYSKMIHKYDNVKWKPWQQSVLDSLKNEPDDRSVTWIVDSKGNSGKSFLCKYIYLKYEGVIIADGKRTDVFNLIKNSIDQLVFPKIVILDIPRCNEKFMNYGTIEKIKDGLIFSGKYEGGVCCFPSPHIICFSNFHPDMEQFSKDRWNLITLYEHVELEPLYGSDTDNDT